MSGASGLDRVESLEVFLVDLSQDKPYLGSLREGETVNESGYFVRKGNRTVYPRNNRSLVIRIRTRDGVEGWGETYGLVAPKATAEIILDLLAGFVAGRSPEEKESLHDELYDLMRVRGYTGGFYLDALAAIDIALWDIVGKQKQRSIAELIHESPRDSIGAYVSGLPKDTLAARCDLALAWKDRGFHSFKFALPVADEGAAPELRALRSTLGPKAKIAADLHWSLGRNSAVSLALELSPDQPWFLEAPVPTEEIEDLRFVAEHSGQKIAVGEEWRTAYDARLRLKPKACHIVQPEMGHTGITEFLRIAQLAETNGTEVIPHATIGSGIFLAASLQASSALPGVTAHEFQHSIFEPFGSFTGEAMRCDAGFYHLPRKPGIGVEPSEEMWSKMTPIHP